MVKILINNPDLESFLAEKGYTFVRSLGQGHTRDVYEVEYVNGSYRDRRVIKIPKPEIDLSSVTTQINLSKGDLNEREVAASPHLSHPNLIKIYDAFSFQNQTITVEEHFDAISLEELVRLNGPMSRDRFKQVFSQVLDGLSHLHETERLLHRDIKPENILVGKHSGTVKIADLQNVGKINDPEVMLPTRGGAAYTAPELLNALLNREKSQCNLATEFYALGATMYYTLTGEKYNQFTLTTHEEGSELVLPQGTIKIALLNQGVRVEQVDIIEEDQKLEQKLAKIPRSYRQLLYSCLNQRHRTYDLVYGSVFEHHRKLTDYFESATKKRTDIQWKRFAGLGITALFFAAAAAGVTYGHKLGEIAERNAPAPPTTYDLLTQRIFSSRNLTGENFPDGTLSYLVTNPTVQVQLSPYFKKAKSSLAQLVQDHSEMIGEGRNFVETASEMTPLDKRLSYSVIRSALMYHPKTVKKYLRARMPYSLVPMDAVLRMTRGDGERINLSYSFHNPIADIGFGVKYLRACLGIEKSIADVIVKYFVDSSEEVHSARLKAGNLNYFDEPGKNGYGRYLGKTQQDLINTALALYYITDTNGTIHFEVLDSNNRPIKGLVAK